MVDVWFVRRSGHQMLLKLAGERILLLGDPTKVTVPPQFEIACCNPGPPEEVT